MLDQNSAVKNSRISFLLLAVILVYAMTIWLNHGFMGTDEYWTGITRYIPAQSADLEHLVGSDDVKSPLQLMPMHFVAQSALALGITSPFGQYKFVQVILGLCQFGLLLMGWSLWRRRLNSRQSEILLFLMGFYFAAPFAFTRPMFESMAAPWIFLAAYFADKYKEDSRISDALWGVACCSLAFALRPQSGICALVFPWLALEKKKAQDFLWMAAVGGLFLFLTGLPDYFLRGGWHFSVKNLILYNAQHGSEYGQQPWTYYPLMLLLLSFFPLLIQKGLSLKSLWSQQKTTWIMLGLFIFAHSLFAQKFERFLIPIISLLFILMLPWLEKLIQNRSWKRLSVLVTLNGALWLAASFSPAQNNIIQMSLFLNQHPEIHRVFRYQETPEWIPESFIQKKQFEFVDLKEDTLRNLELACQDRAVISQGVLDLQPDLLSKKWIVETRFSVNWIEWISYKLNPKNNVRRTELVLFAPTGCEG